MRKLNLSFAYLLGHKGERGIHPDDMMIVNDLRNYAQLDVYSVSDLVNTSDSYPEAIPILVKYLELMKDENFLDGIVWALTCKEAKGIAFEPIYKLYKIYKAENEYLAKSGMANALQYLAEKKDIPRIVELVLDKRNGFTRFYFVDKIASSASKENVTRAKETLVQLSNDSDKDIASRAKKALKRKKFLD